MDAKTDFVRSLFGYLSNQKRFPNNNIIACRKENCDFNFPTSLCIWKQYLNANDYDLPTNLKTIFEFNQNRHNENNLKTEIDQIINESTNWTLQIEKINFTSTHPEQCEILLDRQSTFEKLIKYVTENEGSYGKVSKNPHKTINIKFNHFDDEYHIDVENKSIVIYRSWLIYQTLLHLVNYSEYTVNRNESNNTVTVSHKSTETLNNEDKSKIKLICGTVKDVKNGNKMAMITATDYIK